MYLTFKDFYYEIELSGVEYLSRYKFMIEGNYIYRNGYYIPKIITELPDHVIQFQDFYGFEISKTSEGINVFNSNDLSIDITGSIIDNSVDQVEFNGIYDAKNATVMLDKILPKPTDKILLKSTKGDIIDTISIGYNFQLTYTNDLGRFILVRYDIG